MNFTDFNTAKNNDGLLPAIIQDSDTLKVLMMGYMNAESFQKTVETGFVTFFSRSRKTLWTKGETSGNTLKVVKMYPDCDSDTLLIMAIPSGPTCHRGTPSCFDTPDNEGFIRHLQTVIQGRHSEMPKGSYTSELFTDGVKRIAQKVGEEAVETVVEAVDGNKERFVYEASDLIYHLLVLTEQMGCNLADYEDELTRRHK
jgi:phosphoribosyl-ATP pyrophosphohydrolase/phosphoribosyl-AMP cyclohydrolase